LYNKIVISLIGFGDGIMRRLAKYIVLLGLVACTCSTAGCSSKSVLWHLQYGAEDSDDSMLVIQVGNLYGYADPTGKIRIEPQFQEARPYYEGLAAVKRGGKYGYIDKMGKIIISYRFFFSTRFSWRKGVCWNGVCETRQSRRIEVLPH
jgi:hypothetical protein